MAEEPIEVELGEARRLVEPERLEDVLEALRVFEFISNYIVCRAKVLIWQVPGRRIECALFSADENYSNPERKR